VALEGSPYGKDLNIDMWPWGGTRQAPDWSRFNEAYWSEVERRVRMADIVIENPDLCPRYAGAVADVTAAARDQPHRG
jgi:hypothetical protein